VAATELSQLIFDNVIGNTAPSGAVDQLAKELAELGAFPGVKTFTIAESDVIERARQDTASPDVEKPFWGNFVGLEAVELPDQKRAYAVNLHGPEGVQPIALVDCDTSVDTEQDHLGLGPAGREQVAKIVSDLVVDPSSPEDSRTSVVARQTKILLSQLDDDPLQLQRALPLAETASFARESGASLNESPDITAASKQGLDAVSELAEQFVRAEIREPKPDPTRETRVDELIRRFPDDKQQRLRQVADETTASVLQGHAVADESTDPPPIEDIEVRLTHTHKPAETTAPDLPTEQPPITPLVSNPKPLPPPPRGAEVTRRDDPPTLSTRQNRGHPSHTERDPKNPPSYVDPQPDHPKAPGIEQTRRRDNGVNGPGGSL
jgi:hypothetical protein